MICLAIVSSAFALERAASAQTPHVPTDVIIAFDESGSISAASFVQEKDFVKNLAVAFNANQLFTFGGRVGAIAFATTARQVVSLGSVLQNFVNVVSVTPMLGGSNCLGCAVQLATDHFAAVSSSDRRRVLLLVADGLENVNAAAFPGIVAAAHAAGIEIFALGVGLSASTADLTVLATDPDAEHVFTSATFGNLAGLVAPIASATYPGIDGDGRGALVDVCPFVYDPGQEDAGGVGSGSSPDGIGDACQCGDVDGDGRVTLIDATLIVRASLQPPTATLARPERCDVGGIAGCSLADGVVVRRALLQPPTASIAPQCPPATPPPQP